MHWGFYVTGGMLGLVIGSFLNVVIYRGPARWGLIDFVVADEDDQENGAENAAVAAMTPQTPADRGGFAFPRSYCPACGTTIKPTNLVPILSYILLRGRCAACNAPIGIRYPIVELLGALVVVFALARYGVSMEALLASVFGWTLVALGGIDAETEYLPDALTFPLIAGGIAFNTVDLLAPWPDALLGAILGYGAFWAVSKIYFALRKRDGLGLGDAKLLSAIGAWTGWQALPAVVFLGAVATLAAVGVMAFVAKGREKMTGETPVRFGPGLAAAGFIVLLVGPFFSAL